ncbi:MAG: hypothetical protein Q9162_003413 [Coniocarpon cinnabarinum]
MIVHLTPEAEDEVAALLPQVLATINGFGDGRRGGFGQNAGFQQSSGFDTAPQGRGRGQDNFNQGRQPPSGPGGRGGRGGNRGGFRGRNQERYNDVAGPADAYSLNPEEILRDVTEGKDKPSWVCSCYAPGKNAPAQLIEGDDLEISPEELRYDFYLKMANGQNATEEAANIERMLSEEMTTRINAIGNDPQGAVQYVINGINEHPNRHDILQQYNPKPSETRWSQFTREKQRRRQGVFADQPRSQPWVEPDWRNWLNQGALGSTSSTGFGQQQPVGFSGLGVQNPPNTFGRAANVQQTPGVFSRDNATPVNGAGFAPPISNGTFGQQPITNGFGRPSTPFGQQPQPLVQDDTMVSPTREPPLAQQHAFGQPAGGGFFSNPEAFRQPQQQAQSNGGFSGFNNSTAPPGSGFPQPNNAPQPPSQLPLDPQRAELKQEYDYMNQHGHFRNGIMPETAPEDAWIE